MKQFEDQPKSFRKDPRTIRPKRVKCFDDFTNESKLARLAIKKNIVDDDNLDIAPLERNCYYKNNAILLNISEYIKVVDWEGTYYTENEMLRKLESEDVIDSIKDQLEAEYNITIINLVLQNYFYDDDRAYFYVNVSGTEEAINLFFEYNTTNQ